MKRVTAAILASLLLVACATASRSGASTDVLRKRAAFDLDCEPDQVDIIKIDGKTRGVVGCGSQAAYLEVCEHQNDLLARRCSWMANAKRRIPPGMAAQDLPEVPAGTSKLLRRASFDLLCPVDQLKHTQLGARTDGVRGCGQKAIYSERCEDQNDVALNYCSYFMEQHSVDGAP